MKRGYKQYSLLAILLIAILVISGIPVNAAEETIDDCKKEYAEARARGDAEGMKKANEISVILMD